MRELLSKLDIYGRIENFGLFAKFFEISADICGYLENNWKLGAIPSGIISSLAAIFIILWNEYKGIIITFLIFVTIIRIVQHLNEEYEMKAQKKKQMGKEKTKEKKEEKK